VSAHADIVPAAVSPEAVSPAEPAA
jgi:hypothetical protein